VRSAWADGWAIAVFGQLIVAYDGDRIVLALDVHEAPGDRRRRRVA
jgi:hypothetical protein